MSNQSGLKVKTSIKAGGLNSVNHNCRALGSR